MAGNAKHGSDEHGIAMAVTEDVLMAKRWKAPAGTWQWKAGGPTPAVEAEVFAAELEKLAQGDPLELVEPAAIVAAARKRSSPIHAAFNWNVQEAAEAHWLDHARALVGRLVMVRVEVEAGPTMSSRAWWSVRIQDRKGYAHEDKILSDRDLRLQTIATAKKELLSFLAKFVTVIGSIGNVVPQLQEVIDSIQDEIDRLESAATTRRSRREDRIAGATHPAE